MKPLTGRKVFAITATAFGVIIAVNLFMARQAIATFSGLEVRNSYIASQTFNEDRASQVALGWTVTADVEAGILALAFTDADGNPVDVTDLQATFGRATHVRDDQTPEFAYYNGVFTAPVQAAPGNWNIRLVAHAPDGTAFRQRVVLRVKG